MQSNRLIINIEKRKLRNYCASVKLKMYTLSFILLFTQIITNCLHYEYHIRYFVQNGSVFPTNNDDPMVIK